MMYRTCNRCNKEFRPIHGGKIEMRDRDPSYTGYLCPECYDEIVEAVRSRPVE